jgi:hypothetical protein
MTLLVSYQHVVLKKLRYDLLALPLITWQMAMKG